jgi:regulator of replication initiation timing
MNLIENADQQIRYLLGNLLVENTVLQFENNKLKSELDAALDAVNTHVAADTEL